MTAVVVPSHCPSRAPCTQDDGSLPLVSRWGLPCLWASTWPLRATGHLSPCSASAGFQQPLPKAGGSKTCLSCREIGLFSCNPCNNGQLISIAVYQTIHSTIVLSNVSFPTRILKSYSVRKALFSFIKSICSFILLSAKLL